MLDTVIWSTDTLRYSVSATFTDTAPDTEQIQHCLYNGRKRGHVTESNGRNGRKLVMVVSNGRKS